MAVPELERALADDDAAVFLSLGAAALDDPGPYGAAGSYSLALWLESRAGRSDEGAGAAARRLLKRAIDEGNAVVKARASFALMDRLEETGRYSELLALTTELESAQSRSWRIRRSHLAALDALGEADEALEEIMKLRIAFPDESAGDEAALACIEATARVAKGSSGGTTRSLAALRLLLLEGPPSDWGARALATVEAADAAGSQESGSTLSPDEAGAARMRIAVRAKDYARAYREAALASRAALSASAQMVADAGKAYLYSRKEREGTERFSAIEDSARDSGASAVAWTALFYRGRFARSLGLWRDAATLFERAAASSGSAGVSEEDAEAARWYAAECSGKAARAAAAASIARARAKPGSATALKAEARARGAALDALVSASRAWSDPSAFSDLADELLRSSLIARDWVLVERMSAELSPSLSPTLKARTAYVAARCLELGLSKPTKGSPAAIARLAAVARDETAPTYYRALASWRSGEPVSAAPPDSATAGDGDAPKPGDLEKLIDVLIDFGLDDVAAAESKAESSDLGPTALRRISRRLAARGAHDHSLRVASALLDGGGGEEARGDYLILYPRPYLKELRAAISDLPVAERLALALVRSESAFRADVRSSAGAIGLTQLMPATAADQARALGMGEYDLESPADNLRIGMAYFSSLLERTGSPLRAMMAYNAGMTRFRAWARDCPGLPDDLLVEAATIAETRQYCRNVLQSAALYGELYEGVRPGATAGRIVEGR